MVSKRLASAVDEQDALDPISPLYKYELANVLWYAILFPFFLTHEINMVSIWSVCVQCDNAVLTADDI